MAAVSEKALDVAVFAVCEGFGIAFALDFVEHRDLGLGHVLPSAIVAVLLFLAGAVFPLLRKHIAERKGAALLVVLGAVIASTARLLLGSWWVLVAAISFSCLYVVIPSVLYVVKLRRDLNMYAMPRIVTPKQRDDLRQFLARYGPYPVALRTADRGDQEAIRFHGSLLNALQQTTWPTENDSTLGEPHENLAQGLQIREYGTSLNPNAPKDTPGMILQKAFTVAHIDVNGTSRQSGSSDKGYRLVVLIGRRPLVVGWQPPLRIRIGQWIQGLGARPLRFRALFPHALSTRCVWVSISRRTFPRDLD